MEGQLGAGVGIFGDDRAKDSIPDGVFGNGRFVCGKRLLTAGACEAEGYRRFLDVEHHDGERFANLREE